jgi:L1 cell adhesion molecule like protein
MTQVEILANSLGCRTTPSFVSFVDTPAGHITGDEAKRKLATNAANTVFDAKRIIGCRYSDLSVQKDMRNWPFLVVRGPNDKPLIQVEQSGSSRTYSPEQISSLVLQRMVTTAEAFIGQGNVAGAVITVPAHFNNAQRNATRAAAEVAGLKVLQMVNEPTAAALAYGHDKKFKDKRNLLIYDLGGGTFDVSIISVYHDKQGLLQFDVLATGGDTHLGGQDFDVKLVDHCVQDIRRR